MNSRFSLSTRLVMVLLTLLAALPTRSTPALTSAYTEVWIRTFDSDVVYVAQDRARLSSLCIQIGETASWLPSALLDDIRHPKLEEVEVVRGMGFSDIDQHVPDWESWRVSVDIPSVAEEQERFVDGPTYSFVIHQGRPVFRVEQRWLPSADDPRILQPTEIWVPVPTTSLRDAPCLPPSLQRPIS